ncbi:hypothetical protein ACFW7J_12205 [Streptomyces sp. NPDC059525]|uniref:hypothetical protein n=1 Tax=Streptomyces sp. NPDC059525 TaxID=3346857 RepID=UPI0036A5E822
MSSLRLHDGGDQGEDGEAVLDEAARAGAVGSDQGKQVVRGGDLGEQNLPGGAVADVRCGDRHREQ